MMKPCPLADGALVQWQKTLKTLIVQIANSDVRCVRFALGKVPPFVMRFLFVVIFIHHGVTLFVEL